MVEGRTFEEEPNMRSSIVLNGIAGAVVAASLIASLFVAANRSNAEDTPPSAAGRGGFGDGIATR